MHNEYTLTMAMQFVIELDFDAEAAAKLLQSVTDYRDFDDEMGGPMRDLTFSDGSSCAVSRQHFAA